MTWMKAIRSFCSVLVRGRKKNPVIGIGETVDSAGPVAGRFECVEGVGCNCTSVDGRRCDLYDEAEGCRKDVAQFGRCLKDLKHNRPPVCFIRVEEVDKGPDGLPYIKQGQVVTVYNPDKILVKCVPAIRETCKAVSGEMCVLWDADNYICRKNCGTLGWCIPIGRPDKAHVCFIRAEEPIEIESDGLPYIHLGQIVTIETPVKARVKCVLSEVDVCHTPAGERCLLWRNGCHKDNKQLGWCVPRLRPDKLQVCFVKADGDTP